MEIGRRIYFDFATGNVIVITSERSGHVIETTVEQDFAAFEQLAQRVPETVGFVDIPYGEYRQEFSDGFISMVNPETSEFTWTWHEPEAVEERKTLEQEVQSLKEENTNLMLAMTDVYEQLLVLQGGAV